MPASERARTRRASGAWPAASRSSAVRSGGAPRSGPSLANSVGSGDSSGEAVAPTSYSTTRAPRSKPSSVARCTTGSATGSSLTTATIVGWSLRVHAFDGPVRDVSGASREAPPPCLPCDGSRTALARPVTIGSFSERTDGREAVHPSSGSAGEPSDGRKGRPPLAGSHGEPNSARGRSRSPVGSFSEPQRRAPASTGVRHAGQPQARSESVGARFAARMAGYSPAIPPTAAAPSTPATQPAIGSATTHACEVA